MFKRLNVNAVMPTAKTTHSAGFDVVPDTDRVSIVPPHTTVVIPTGIALDVDQEDMEGYYFGLYLRSSVGKSGLIMPNSVGIIDIDYKDEIGIIAHNITNLPIPLVKGKAIAQLILHKHHDVMFKDSFKRLQTTRTGGMGSTNG